MTHAFAGKWSLLGLGLVALTTSIPVAAEESASPAYRIFKADEYRGMPNPNPSQRMRIDLLTPREAAKSLGGAFGVIPPLRPGDKPAFHLHRNRESVLIIVSGEAMEQIGNDRFPLKPGDVVFIPPNLKHGLANGSTTQELRYMEFFTHPPLMSDYVEVKDPT